MTAPTGLHAVYEFSKRTHPLGDVPSVYWTSSTRVIEACFKAYSLNQKTLTGPGIGPQTWTYDYAGYTNYYEEYGSPYASCGWYKDHEPPDAQSVKFVDAIAPDGVRTRYTHSILFDESETALLKVEVFAPNQTSPIRKTEYTYEQGGAVGVSGVSLIANAATIDNARRTIEVKVTQEGTSYTTTNSNFDSLEFPQTQVEVGPSGTRTRTTAYFHDLSDWVIGQVASTTINGTVASSTQFDANSQPSERRRFGLLESTIAYHGNGEVHTVTNGENEQTLLLDYYRGSPKNFEFPDESTASQTFNAFGEVETQTNENGSETSYGYDSMGRLSSITYPSPDSQNWTSRTISYQPLSSSQLGVDANSWRMQVTQGKYRKRVYYDALMRPVLEEEKDTSSNGETIYRRHEYDYDGREIATSYPSDDYQSTNGVKRVFDAIGRLTVEKMTDEDLLSTVEYLSNSRKRVIDAEGNTTEIKSQAFGQPAYDAPVQVVAPEGQSTVIQRDVFGNILSATQSGNFGGNTVTATQSWAYDSHKRLCRKVEPETAGTVLGYDLASRVIWQAKGQSGSGCASSAPSGSTYFTYDDRGRQLTVDHPGTADDISFGYDLAGNLLSVTNPTASWTYTYNKRNLLESETVSIDDRVFSLDPEYDSLGHLVSRVYPSGRTVSYSPDAWGRPRALGNWVTGVEYHPNDLLESYTLANSLTHSQTVNDRQWPERVRTLDGGSTVQDFEYLYNDSADITAINDYTDGADTVGNLDYDGLHRLTRASGIWGTYEYQYDPLNNIRARTQTGSLSYSYTASTNRVSAISGSQSRNYSYDSRGRVTSDGLNTYIWNDADRVKEVTGKATYHYDGNGKRIKIEKSDGTIEYNLYDRSGDLVYTYRIRPEDLSALSRSITGEDEAEKVLAQAETVPTNPRDQKLHKVSQNREILRGTMADLSIAGGSSSSKGRFYTVAGLVPPVPDGLAPGAFTAPGPTQSGTTIDFSWNDSAEAGSYRIAIYNETTGAQVVQDMTTGNVTVYQAELEADTPYSWQVRGCTLVTLLCSAFSDPVYFVTPTDLAPPPIPGNLSPGSTSSPGPTTADSNVSLSWSAAGDATSYTVQVVNQDTAATVVNSTTANTSLSAALDEGTAYKWRVRGCNGAGCSSYSSYRYFETPAVLVPPAIPGNPSPGSTSAPGPTTGGRSVSLSWSAVADAANYTVKVFNEDTGDAVLTKTATGTQYTATLDYDVAYRWRVRACNDAGCSGYTSNRYFQTPPVPVIESETDYLSLGGQTLVEVEKVDGTTTVSYLHPDLLGSPRRATNASKTQLWREHYDPYGMKLNGIDEKIGYTGHAYDAATGLTYMQARFYDPLVGRFLSTDPVGFDASNPYGFNRYAYANNNPYRYTDPNGEFVLQVGGTIGGAAVGLLVTAGYDLVRGDVSSFGTYVGAAAGGAAAGLTLTTTFNPTAAGAAAAVVSGAVGGAVGSVVQQSIDTGTVEGGQVAASAAVGAAIGAVAPGVKVPGITAGRNSFGAVAKSAQTKLSNGTISTVSGSTVAKAAVASGVEGSAGAVMEQGANAGVEAVGNAAEKVQQTIQELSPRERPM